MRKYYLNDKPVRTPAFYANLKKVAVSADGSFDERLLRKLMRKLNQGEKLNFPEQELQFFISK